MLRPVLTGSSPVALEASEDLELCVGTLADVIVLLHFPLRSLPGLGTGQQPPGSWWSWSLQVFSRPSGAGQVLLAPVPLVCVVCVGSSQTRGEGFVAVRAFASCC